MVDILHKVGIQSSSPRAVYSALTTMDGLAGWWTSQTSGNGDVGGVIEFRFGPGGKGSPAPHGIKLDSWE